MIQREELLVYHIMPDVSLTERGGTIFRKSCSTPDEILKACKDVMEIVSRSDHPKQCKFLAMGIIYEELFSSNLHQMSDV